jgi:predicted dehydrogenase
MRRHDAGVLAAKELIETLRKSEELGSIVSVSIIVEAGDDYCNLKPRISTLEARPDTDENDIAPEWLPANMRGDYERFVNVCSHDINLMRFLLAESPKVIAVSHRPAGFSFALLDFGEYSGVMEWGYRGGGRDAGREGIDIRFERGEVSLRLPPAFLRNVSATVRLTTGRTMSTVGRCSSSNIDFSWSFERSDRAFVSDVLTGSAPISSGADSLKDFQLIDSIWRELA